MNDMDKIKRADRADAILNDPLISEALGHWEQEITEAWKNSNPSDADAHRNLRSLLEASRRLRKYLETLSQTGKLIKAAPTRTQRIRERIGM